jgi:hypothetical protein
MNIIIKKAAIRSGMFLNYEFEQRDEISNNNIKTQSDAPIHDDLAKAFRQLIPHFAFITDEISEELARKCIDDPETFIFQPLEDAPEPRIYNFHVHEFSIMDKKGLNFVSISGSKTLLSKDTISFSTPSVDLDSLNDYKFVQQLSTLVEVLKKEVLLYMEGKQSERRQLEMFKDEDLEDDAIEMTISTTDKNGNLKEVKTNTKKLQKLAESVSAFEED